MSKNGSVKKAWANICIYMREDDLLAWLRASAKHEGRSCGNFVRRLLEQEREVQQHRKNTHAS